jgi:hypothetical protein
LSHRFGRQAIAADPLDCRIGLELRHSFRHHHGRFYHALGPIIFDDHVRSGTMISRRRVLALLDAFVLAEPWPAPHLRLA